MNGYWSASIVALGGALVLGAWPRLRKHVRTRDALLMSLGLVILANSRPYEGLIFAVPIACAMLFWLLGRNRPASARSLLRVVSPIFFALLVASVATSYFYWRVTGNPFRMTYQVNHATYGGPPYFLWQTPTPAPAYHHEVMRGFYGLALEAFHKQFTVATYLRYAAEKAGSLWHFYLDPLLTLPFLAVPWVVHQKKMRLPFSICAVTIAGIWIETWTLPHYFCPAVGALYIILVQCFRQLWCWGRTSILGGRAWVRAIPVLACAMIALRVTTAAAHVQIEQAWPRGNLKRALVLHQLQQFPGPQLVIVSYGKQHDANSEWVYNDADIDRSKVVWARDMGKSRNQELLQYFSDRKSWLVEGDSPVPRLLTYPAE